METEALDPKLKEIVSNKEFVEKLLSLKTKDEVKKLFLDNSIEIDDSGLDQLGAFLKELMSKLKDNNGKLTDEQLSELSGGRYSGGYDTNGRQVGEYTDAVTGHKVIVQKKRTPKFVRYAGNIVSFPFKSVAYAAGAIIGGIPKGVVDGYKDAWYEEVPIG